MNPPELTQRQRFLRYMRFQPVDRIPLMEMGVWPETLERWHHEGLPKWVTHDRHLEAYLHLDLSFNRNWLEINDRIYPAFEPTVVEETETDEIICDEMGVLLRQQKHHRSIPQYIRFPVQNEADYERLLEGAYVPFLDHFVPPDVSYETYVHYVERRRELLANPDART